MSESWRKPAPGDLEWQRERVVVRDSRGSPIATVHCTKRRGLHGAANVNLIAAAPELLAACKAIELLADAVREGRYGDYYGSLGIHLVELSGTQVREAIAKAEGKTRS